VGERKSGRIRFRNRRGAADMLGAMPTGFEHLSKDELLDSLSFRERDADGIARTPELLVEFENFTEQDAEEWGAMEDPAAEAAFESLVRAGAQKASAT